MEFFKWKDSFNIGIDEIDRQHREFFALLNDYFEVLTHVRNATVGPELVGKLKSYIAMHFDYEIKMLEVNGYAEMDMHLVQHEYFTARVSQLDESMVRGDNEKLYGVTMFLRDWFLTHILDCDRKYAPYIKTAMLRSLTGA